jgi:hypothetical protein
MYVLMWLHLKRPSVFMNKSLEWTWDSNVFMGNTLIGWLSIDIYAKCQSMEVSLQYTKW